VYAYTILMQDGCPVYNWYDSTLYIYIYIWRKSNIYFFNRRHLSAPWVG